MRDFVAYFSGLIFFVLFMAIMAALNLFDHGLVDAAKTIGAAVRAFRDAAGF